MFLEPAGTPATHLLPELVFSVKFGAQYLYHRMLSCLTHGGARIKSSSSMDASVTLILSCTTSASAVSQAQAQPDPGKGTYCSRRSTPLGASQGPDRSPA